MIVTSDLTKLVLAGMKTEFDNAYAKRTEKALWKMVADELPTTLKTQDYAFMGYGAVMQQFVDRSQEQEATEKSYTLSDLVYDAMIKIKRTTLEDEQYGLLNKRAQGLAGEAARHWNQLVFQGLALGATTNCYDAQYFIDTDHSEGASGTQSNKGTSALSVTSLAAAELAMLGFLNDKGLPMEIQPDTLVVGPKLKKIATEILGSKTVVINVGDGTAGSGATAATDYDNYFQGSYRLIVSPYLIGTYDDYWFLLDTSREIKPVIIQSRSDVPMSIESDLGDDTAAMKEEYKFRVRERKVQGYGLWQTAYGGIL
jgi:phage major head subunit gpT-like protein